MVLRRVNSEKSLPLTFLWYDKDRIENNTTNNFSIVSCVFIAAETCLEIRCLAKKEGIHMKTQQGDLTSKLLFLKNMGSRL
jgi:hypothetical protein